MSPVTHFFAGWVLACASPVVLRRREKALVVAAAVAPDLDGLGLIPELLTRHSSHPLLWFSEYHHELHTLAFAMICTIGALVATGPLANRKTRRNRASDSNGNNDLALHSWEPGHPWVTALLVFVSFHLHLLCDLAGARGPEGYQWPIPYLEPFSKAAQLTWHGQWALNGWQNFIATGLLLAATLWIAWRHGSSPVELVSAKWNSGIVQAVQARFSSPDSLP